MLSCYCTANIIFWYLQNLFLKPLAYSRQTVYEHTTQYTDGVAGIRGVFMR